MDRGAVVDLAPLSKELKAQFSKESTSRKSQRVKEEAERATMLTAVSLSKQVSIFEISATKNLITIDSFNTDILTYHST